MPLSVYRAASRWQSFQADFCETVMTRDRNYYGPLSSIIRSSTGRNDARQVVLLDLCRASFVRRGSNGPPRRDESGDGVVLAAPSVYDIYVEANKAWTWRRLMQGNERRVVALGTIAEHGLLRLFQGVGCEVTHSITGLDCQLKHYPEGRWVRRYAQVGCVLGQWLEQRAWWNVRHEPSGREWRVLPVAHPSRSQADAGYLRASEVIRAMLL